MSQCPTHKRNVYNRISTYSDQWAQRMNEKKEYLTQVSTAKSESKIKLLFVKQKTMHSVQETIDIW